MAIPYIFAGSHHARRSRSFPLFPRSHLILFVDVMMVNVMYVHWHMYYMFLAENENIILLRACQTFWWPIITKQSCCSGKKRRVYENIVARVFNIIWWICSFLTLASVSKYIVTRGNVSKVRGLFIFLIESEIFRRTLLDIEAVMVIYSGMIYLSMKVLTAVGLRCWIWAHT